MVRFVTDSCTAPTGKSSLQVIGAGLPRTATSSLQAALEQLGFNPCLHMAQIIPHADRQQLLLDAAREKDTARRQKLIHQLVDGYAAVCDMPAIFFLPDLMDMFPDAKVVLSSRPNADNWAKSSFESLSFFFSPWFYGCGLLWKTDRLWYQLNMHILDWCDENYDLQGKNIFTASLYEQYNDSVRAAVQERGRSHLEFKAEDGWHPLCEFLEKEVPGTEFPKMNERKTFAIIKGLMITKGVLSWAAVGGAVWLGWRYAPALLK